MREAEHFPAGQRFGYGKLDDDLTFFICLQVRVEEGGLIKVCAGFYLGKGPRQSFAVSQLNRLTSRVLVTF